MRSSLILFVPFALVAFGCTNDDGLGTSNPRTSSTAPPDNTTPGQNDTVPPASTGTPPPPGTTVGTETWADGKQITGNVTIDVGQTVTIAAGATITVSAGVAITVKGTLVATTGATHAKLNGAEWAGLVIASGGTLTADSLDLTGGKIGIWTQAGDAAATFANGVITADQPFNMEAGSKLSITKSTVTASSSESAIAGTFTASYMTYDKGSNEGLYVSDAASTVTMTDSTLKGAGGGDYIVVNVGGTLNVSYTTISGSHCPFHFGPGAGPNQYTVDHVSDDTNAYGWMMYGSGAGPSTVTNSNFRDITKNIEMTGTNGKVTLTNNFFGTAPNVLQSAATVTNPATAAIVNAKPR